MDLLSVLFLGAIFLFSVAIVFVVYLFLTESKYAEKRILKKRLYYISAGGMHGWEKLSKYHQKVLNDAGIFERLSFKVPRVSRLDKLLIKAKFPLNATIFIVGSIALGCIGLLAGLKFLPQPGAAVVFGGGLLALPYYLLKRAETAYDAKFQELLPEALDLLARAMRSGHALTAGFEILSTEMEDPIKSEFTSVVDEIKLGLSLDEAFDNLCERVPCTDLQFFTITVLVQKETGGNITEVLDNISRLIRERVKFARDVRTISAEGKFSAIVLISVPLVMFFYAYNVNYNYISLLWTDEIGRYMFAAAIIGQIVGALIIKKMVKIEI